MGISNVARPIKCLTKEKIEKYFLLLENFAQSVSEVIFLLLLSVEIIHEDFVESLKL